MNNQLPINNQVNTNIQGKNVLYLSDLPSNVTESDLRMFFDAYKEKLVLINISNAKSNDFSQYRGANAKVIFKDSQAADDARRGLNMKKIKGKTVRVMWDERDNSVRYNNQTNIFVKNIPFEIKPRDFYEHFLQFGDIASAKVNEDEDGNHLGYGYICYYDADSATKAIQATDGKEVWGSKLEVKNFQKKNERLTSLTYTNKNIYLKNFPSNFTNEDLKTLCKKYGEVSSCKIYTDISGRNYGIVSYVNEESVQTAKNGLNTMDIDGYELYVDTLQKKEDRKKVLSYKINESNHRLNEQYKYCNLHVRNIPYDAKEEDLTDAFKKFGVIKSVKIEKYLLVTKQNNEFIQIPTSKGFGYVCFETPEAAATAKEEMSYKFLSGFESWNRPLLVEFFISKSERNLMNSKFNQMNQFGGGDFKFPFGFPPMNMHPAMMQKNRSIPTNYQPVVPQTNPQIYMQPMPVPQQIIKKEEEIDMNYFNSLEDDTSRRDYLGEIIFKRIENHVFTLNQNFPIDLIGKITGMILGIDDFNEIIDICKNNDNLTQRIGEAYELLQSHKN